MRFEYALSAAWKIWHCDSMPFSSHAFDCAGASPNHDATSALTFGDTIQFIHLYEQVGCLVFAATIHVSDQPVEPSDGTIALTFTFLSLCTRFVMTCHVVPTTVVFDSNAWTALV